MKKISIILFALIICGCSGYKVYSVRDNPKLPVRGGVVYALPRTQLRVAVTVERRDLTSAPYARYADDMLGATPADIDTNYRIVDIDVTPYNVADPDYYYFVKIRRGSVTVDERHLLLAVGSQHPTSNSQHPTTNGQQPTANGQQPTTDLSYNLYDHADTFYTRYDAPGKPSLVTTKKDVRTVRQRADEAARRIGDLQTRQFELLNGEADGSPDGETMRFVITQLRRQEESLKSLFLGETRRETVFFYVDPVMLKGAEFVDTIIWFSPKKGFVGSEEQSGTQKLKNSNTQSFPIVCTVLPGSSLKGASRFVRYHTAGATPSASSNRTGKAASKSRARKSFRYRIPEQASVSIFTPQFSLSRQIPISQFGPTVELPRHRIKALFDPQTLDLRELRIEK